VKSDAPYGGSDLQVVNSLAHPEGSKHDKRAAPHLRTIHAYPKDLLAYSVEAEGAAG